MVPGARPSGGAAHSASTSGGGGSPSDRGGAAPSASASASTPASESTVARRLNGLDLQGDDAPSSQLAVSKKKKRGARAVGPDKNGCGLRQFSMRVCEKVESKGRTTYNEVADELVAEFTDSNNIESPDPDNPNVQQYDEKNIRRKVYDALNVLMAMEIISKDKKEIQWKGLPQTSMNDVEELKKEIIGTKARIEKKSTYLQELQDQGSKLGRVSGGRSASLSCCRSASSSPSAAAGRRRKQGRTSPAGRPRRLRCEEGR